RLYAVAAENRVALHKYAAGDSFAWGGSQVRVLSPPPGWQPRPKRENDDSLVLLITHSETSALMAGDLVKRLEKLVVAESPHADLLKVAHHGSATSTIPEFLAAVQPKVAVISAGYHNSFGHPRPEVLERLQGANVSTYRTDMLGIVTFLLDGKK